MNTETGEIKQFESQAARDAFVAEKNKAWVECAIEPTEEQKQTGVKGHHDCLCGSGRKFRDCCRVCKCGSGKLARECCRASAIYTPRSKAEGASVIHAEPQKKVETVTD